MGIVEIIVSGIVGLIVGVGGALAIKNKPIEQPQQHQGTEQAIKQLTALELTQPICQPDYIALHGNLLCRELTCLQFSRGLDSQTSGAQCESISNIANKIQIQESCSKVVEKDERESCIDLFWKRN